MKHRDGGKSKIKSEHAIIPGVKALLQSLENWEEIQGIIPGRIKPINKSHALHLKIQYQTKAGVKCLALSGPAVQEVFFISNQPKLLIEKLQSL